MFALPARRTTRVFALLPVIVPALVWGCKRDVGPPAITDAQYQAAYDTFLTTRSASLVTAGKPNSFTGLRWLKQGPSTIGSDSTNAVVLKGRDVPAKVGTLTREGFVVRFDPAPGVNVLIDSAPASARALVTDAGPGTQSRVDVGSAGFKVIKRVDSVGVRMWDADLATMKNLEPLEYFKRDPAWRLGAKFVRREKPDTQAVATISGVAEEYINVGTLSATIDGKPYEMTAFAGKNPVDLFITFSDATSGEDTYGFRFLHAPLDTVTNTAVMDFNFAYNPDCAFSAYTTCPLPPPNNRLTARILAGEKKAKHIAAAKL